MVTKNLSKGTQTRNQIIVAAHALFADQGYHGTSMRQIAESAGITLGGIYNHFSGKEDIFKSLIIEYHPIAEVVPKLESFQGSNVPETVHFAANTIQRTFKDRGDYINLLFAELIEFQGEHISEVFREIFPKAIETAKKLLKERELRSKNVPVMFMSFLALMFASFIANRFINQRTLGKFVNLDMNEVVDLYLYGIMADQQEGKL